MQRKSRRNRWLVLVALVGVVVLAACGGDDEDKKDEGGLQVNDPWVRATLAEGEGEMVTGAFMTVENTSDKIERLVSVRVSPEIASTVEIHETTLDENDVMQMRPVDGVDVPAQGNLVLKPGSYHIMLLGVQKSLAPGDTVDLTLVFASGTEIEVSAEVRAME